MPTYSAAEWPFNRERSVNKIVIVCEKYRTYGRLFFYRSYSIDKAFSHNYHVIKESFSSKKFKLVLFT